MKPALPAVETRLVEIINAYWRKRGYALVDAKVCEVADTSAVLGAINHYFAVRSNIGSNGFPPGKPSLLHRGAA